MSYQEKASLLAAMQPENRAAALAALGSDEAIMLLLGMPMEERASVLTVMSPEERSAALAQMNQDDRHELLSWRICAGCALIGSSFAFFLWVITSGVAHTPRLIDYADDRSAWYAGLLASAIAITSVYILYFTIWPVLSAPRQELDPQGHGPLVKAYAAILILGMVLQGCWRRTHEDQRPLVAVLSVMACLQAALACTDLMIRRKATPGPNFAQADMGWRFPHHLFALFGHASGLSLIFSVYFDLPEIFAVVFFCSYWWFTCAADVLLYGLSLFVLSCRERNLCGDKTFSCGQKYWKFVVRYNLQDRLVATLWTLSVVLSMIAIPDHLYSVLAVVGWLALGFLYQYVHHCLEYRDSLSRVSELEWVSLESDEDTQDGDVEVPKNKADIDGVETEMRVLMPGVKVIQKHL
jgi:hypothetical protein